MTFRILLLPTIIMMLTMNSRIFSCGTVEMFSSLYFPTAFSDVECKKQALRGLLCVTPLDLYFYQTKDTPRMLRLVLNDALNYEDNEIKKLAEKIPVKYILYDKNKILNNVRKYKRTKKDIKLIQSLSKAGVQYLEVFCNGKVKFPQND